VIQGSFSYTSRAFGDVVDEVNARNLTPSFLITHRYSLDEWSNAIRVLRGGVTDHEVRGKVVISLT
jgi:threonine dehydrogenase-like Zn-dependent dehydrogenase